MLPRDNAEPEVNCRMNKNKRPDVRPMPRPRMHKPWQPLQESIENEASHGDLSGFFCKPSGTPGRYEPLSFSKGGAAEVVIPLSWGSLTSGAPVQDTRAKPKGLRAQAHMAQGVACSVAEADPLLHIPQLE